LNEIGKKGLDDELQLGWGEAMDDELEWVWKILFRNLNRETEVNYKEPRSR
jgi:hypothetical protein